MTSRRRDPDTSKAAAAAIEAHVSRIQQQILAALSQYPGLTTREIEHHTGINFATVTPRMVTMEENGWVQRTQFRRRAPHGKGVGIVWGITTKGEAALL